MNLRARCARRAGEQVKTSQGARFRREVAATRVLVFGWVGGAVGLFLLGWGCTALAGGFVSLLRLPALFITRITTSLDIAGHRWTSLDYEILPIAFLVGDGVLFGLLTGWLVGAVVVLAYRKVKPGPPKTTAWASPGPGPVG
ncbi:hypothetical protein ACFFMN_04155 [Planobispora siamensis]|uniref:Uncharacterized protein n=1 Tax=Planobispora siamensis TaxID=936338 RepID=A0A8J3WK76_9ACTN|nr:hypothetical protein [Planobispora siamensis]GIH92448.1 hypothetical protein Psi01_30780 [Planobispora siamensis]